MKMHLILAVLVLSAIVVAPLHASTRYGWVGKKLTFNKDISVPSDDSLYFVQGIKNQDISFLWEDKCVLSLTPDEEVSEGPSLNIKAGSTAFVMLETSFRNNKGDGVARGEVRFTTKLENEERLLYVMCDKKSFPRPPAAQTEDEWRHHCKFIKKISCEINGVGCDSYYHWCTETGFARPTLQLFKIHFGDYVSEPK